MTPDHIPGIEQAIAFVEARFPDLNVKHRYCPQCDHAHQESPRQYAHTAHFPGTICWAHAIIDLPVEHQIGICLHEYGHVIAGDRDQSEFDDEADADQAVLEELGVEIKYLGDRELQWVDEETLRNA